MFEKIDNIGLVSAAGAGKTRALTRRFLLLYLHKANYPLASLYGITFTNEAAFEMKKRIFSYLDLLAGHRVDKDQDKSEKDIFRYFSDFVPDIKETTKKKKRYLLNNLSDLHISTFHSLFASFLSSMPFAAGILPGYRIIEETQEETIFDLSLDKFFDNVHQNKDLQHVVNELLEQQETNIKESIRTIFWNVIPYFEFLKNLIAQEAIIRKSLIEQGNKYCEALNNFKNFIHDHEACTYTKNTKQMNKNLCDFLAKIDKCIETEDPDVMADYIFGVDIASKNYFQSFIKNLGDGAHEFNAILDRAKNTELEYLNLLSDQQILIHLKPILEIHREFQKVKQDKNLLSFSDIETYTLQALQNNPEPDYLYFKIGAEMNHLMIDEFQDTSFRQLEILEPLIAEILAVEPSEKSFFYVGDPRQAIFRWRGGTPELFNLLKEKYPGKIKEEELIVNYRSKENIIDFVNMVLGKNDKAKPGNTGGWVRTVNLGEFSDREQGEDVIIEKTLTIAEDLHDNFGYEYSDIAVLVRSNKFGTAIAEEFARNHVPCISKSRADILSDNDVRFVLNLLKFLDDPENDFALLPVLLSSAFNLKEETLRQLKSGKKTLYLALLDLYPQWHATKKLQKLLALVHFTNPYELIYQIYQELELRISYSLATLLDFALDYTKQGFNHLSTFISWLEHAGAATEIKEIHPEGVKVLTVHKAKGLEFEVVIIPETNWLLPRFENRQLIFSYKENSAEPERIYWRKYGKYFKNLATQEQERLKRDELNLLYVALTRAKSGVYVLGFESPRIELGFWFDAIREKTGDSNYALGEVIKKETTRHAKEKHEPYGPISEEPMMIKEERTLYSPTERGVEIIEPARRRGMEFGDMIHKALARIEWLDSIDSEKIANDIITYIKNAYVRLPEDASRIDSKLVPLLTETLTDPDLRFLFYRGNRDTKCKNELPVYFEEEKRDISAHIDRLIIEGDNIFIIDYKTGDEKPEYKKQMHVYKTGIQKIYPGKIVKTLLVYLEKDRGKKIVEV